MEAVSAAAAPQSIASLAMTRLALVLLPNKLPGITVEDRYIERTLVGMIWELTECNISNKVSPVQQGVLLSARVTSKGCNQTKDFGITEVPFICEVIAISFTI